jgi:hypothetical protein
MGVVLEQDLGTRKAWEWFLQRTQEQEKTKTKSDESNTHTVKPTKGKEHNPSKEVRVKDIIWFYQNKKRGTTGVCRKKRSKNLTGTS